MVPKLQLAQIFNKESYAEDQVELDDKSEGVIESASFPMFTMKDRIYGKT